MKTDFDGLASGSALASANPESVRQPNTDRCAVCGKACCACDKCRAIKGHRADICSGCFYKTKAVAK